METTENIYWTMLSGFLGNRSIGISENISGQYYLVFWETCLMGISENISWAVLSGFLGDRTQ